MSSLRRVRRVRLNSVRIVLRIWLHDLSSVLWRLNWNKIGKNGIHLHSALLSCLCKWKKCSVCEQVEGGASHVHPNTYKRTTTNTMLRAPTCRRSVSYKSTLPTLKLGTPSFAKGTSHSLIAKRVPSLTTRVYSNHTNVGKSADPVEQSKQIKAQTADAVSEYERLHILL